jgi:hypothetical protein
MRRTNNNVPVPQNRSRHILSKAYICAVILVVAAIILLIWTVMSISVNTAKNTKASTEVKVDGSVVTLFTKEAKAEKHTSVVVNGTSTMEVDTNAEIISIEVTSNGKSWSADSDNIMSQIVGLVSDPAVIYNGDMTFTLNANACEDGGTVLVSVKSYSSSSKLDKMVNEGVKTSYFTFTAVHSDAEENKTAEDDNTQAASTSQAIMPSGTMVFDGVTYQTYSTQDDALANPIGIPGTVASGCTIKGIPGENTTRMRLWVSYVSEGYLPGLELFLYSDKDWTDTLDLSELAGKTIVLTFASETGDLVPKVSYEYVAMVVPNTPMAVTSTDSQNEGTNNP